MDFAIMVEGYTDVISMHQAGVENVVASSGTSLTVEQIQLLHRFTRNITVIYDGDAAGMKASLRGIDLILKEGMNVRVVLLPTEDDPDSFARSHSADEVQSYIRENEEDFLTFKAKLLLRDAGRDPIKRAEVIRDMVESIILVPDAIQRSVFTKECARIMDVDESMLISEVARKRAVQSGDRETEEFIRREQARIRHEQKSAAAAGSADGASMMQKNISAGSSEEALEREIIKYLLKSGHKNFEVKEHYDIISINIADEIFRNLEKDNIEFSNRVYNQLLATYREHWCELGIGVEVGAQYFVNHPDPEVCNAAVDILTSDDNYVPSNIWQRKDVHVESEEEILSTGVPKAIMLYRSKVVERMIKAQLERLADTSLSEQDEAECIKQLDLLNKVKAQLAKESQRLIL
jgi:DNA primase